MDALHFNFKFELVGFKFDDTVYRFDFYPTKISKKSNAVIWLPKHDQLNEFDIGYDKTHFEKVHKINAYEVDGKKVIHKIYRGFKFDIVLHRDPRTIIFITIFYPSLVLGVFLYFTFYVEEYGDVLANLSISLMAYISILNSI